jgi:ribokinase
MNIDLLAIGDIATEPFIKIKEAEAKCDKEGDHCKLCINYGGKIPYESALICRAVGNSSNVSVSASRLGLNSYLMSYVGNDDTGKGDIEQLHFEKVKTDYITTVNGLESNHHYVLWYGVERTILVKHTEFPYSFPKDLPEPKWIYLSSLASNSLSYHYEILEYLKNHPNVSLAFQPGTFQIRFGVEALKDIYKRTNVFLCNHDEAKRILKTEENDIVKLLKMIYELGPKIIVITDGEDGSYAFNGKDAFYMKAFKQTTIESTGAGDAFSAAFVVALLLGKKIPEALMWGSANASSVVSYVGPHKGLMTREQLENYIKNAPIDFEPINII